MKETKITIYYLPLELVEFKAAATLSCPLLSRVELGGAVVRVNCTTQQCALWRTVVPPPGDKLGNCYGSCTLPEMQRETIEYQAHASAA